MRSNKSFLVFSLFLGCGEQEAVQLLDIDTGSAAETTRTRRHVVPYDTTPRPDDTGDADSTEEARSRVKRKRKNPDREETKRTLKTKLEAIETTLDSLEANLEKYSDKT